MVSSGKIGDLGGQISTVSQSGGPLPAWERPPRAGDGLIPPGERRPPAGEKPPPFWKSLPPQNKRLPLNAEASPPCEQGSPPSNQALPPLQVASLPTNQRSKRHDQASEPANRAFPRPWEWPPLPMNRPSERGSVTRSLLESGGALRLAEPRSLRAAGFMVPMRGPSWSWKRAPLPRPSSPVGARVPVGRVRGGSGFKARRGSGDSHPEAGSQEPGGLPTGTQPPVSSNRICFLTFQIPGGECKRWSQAPVEPLFRLQCRGSAGGVAPPEPRALRVSLPHFPAFREYSGWRRFRRPAPEARR